MGAASAFLTKGYDLSSYVFGQGDTDLFYRFYEEENWCPTANTVAAAPVPKENLRFCAGAGQYTACQSGERRAKEGGRDMEKAEGDFYEVRRILGARCAKSRGRFRALNAEI